MLRTFVYRIFYRHVFCVFLKKGFLKDFIYLFFGEKRREGERERNIDV